MQADAQRDLTGVAPGYALTTWNTWRAFASPAKVALAT